MDTINLGELERADVLELRRALAEAARNGRPRAAILAAFVDVKLAQHEHSEAKAFAAEVRQVIDGLPVVDLEPDGPRDAHGSDASRTRANRAAWGRWQ